MYEALHSELRGCGSDYKNTFRISCFRALSFMPRMVLDASVYDSEEHLEDRNYSSNKSCTWL